MFIILTYSYVVLFPDSTKHQKK